MLACFEDCEEQFVAQEVPLKPGSEGSIVYSVIRRARQQFRRAVVERVGGELALARFDRRRKRNARGGFWLMGMVHTTVEISEVFDLFEDREHPEIRARIVEAARELVREQQHG